MKLLTGATGFVGSYLLYYMLKRGDQVRATFRSGSSMLQTRLIFEYLAGTEGHSNGYGKTLIDKAEWVEADLLDNNSMLDALNGVEEIIHSAATVSFKPSEADQVLKTNLHGTASLVNMALEKSISRFVYISSVASLPRESNKYVDETFNTDRMKFSSVYAESKYRAEMEVWRGFAEGLKVLVVNPGVILGPCDFNHGGASASFFNAVYEGVSFYPTGANAFVDVRDVALKTLELEGMDDAWGQRYILISENLPYRDVIFWACDELGVNRPFLRTGLWMGYMGYGLDKIRTMISRGEPKLTPNLVYTVSKNFYYDNSRVKNLLTSSFLPVKLSVRDSCQFFLETKDGISNTSPKKQKSLW